MSSYELLFMQWLEDAVIKKFIDEWSYEPRTFTVFDKVKNKFLNNKTKTIISTIKYTPDFKIKFTEKFHKTFPSAAYNLSLIEHEGYIWIDIKSKFQGQTTSSNASFPPKRALLWNRENIYVSRITLDKKYNWFFYTYIPKHLAYMKNRKEPTLKKAFLHCKIL